MQSNTKTTVVVTVSALLAVIALVILAASCIELRRLHKHAVEMQEVIR